jgi:ATP-binding cassette subfamily C (CFTR/MRP) protein 1
MLRSSRNLDNNMLKSILKSTMHFFESTPIGRIINRFSKDMYSIEFILPISSKDFFYCIFDVLTTIVIISISTPFFVTVIVPLMVLYMVVQVSLNIICALAENKIVLIISFLKRVYVISCSKLKRLDSVSRSPVFSHLGETLNGISTIKAYQVEERFLNTIHKRIDDNNQFFYPINVLEWYFNFELIIKSVCACLS